MKIACGADLHIGASTYGRIDAETGLNTRVLNVLSSLDEMCDYVIDNEIPILVLAGDMYHNSTPSRTMSDEFDKRIKRLSEAGIHIMMLDGNHDVSKMPQTKSPTAHFGTLGVPMVVHSRFNYSQLITVKGETVKFVFLPTYHTKEEILRLTSETDTTTYPTIFVFHGTIQGAMLNEWNIADKETYIPLEYFSDSGAIATVMGHLHKPQILSEDGLVFYTGSLQRIDFSEEKQAKGFVVLDVNDFKATYNFHEVPSQEFLTLRFDIEEGKDATAIIIQRLNSMENIENKIVRIQVNLTHGTSLNDARIIEHAYSLKAGYVLDIKKIYPRLVTTRVEGLTSDISEEEALRMYFKDHENGERRVKRGLEIIEELKKVGRL